MDRELRKQLLSIGEMAEANRVSVATLRLYDRMGLLKPSHRDEASGYRYYDIRQTSRLDIIRYMQSLGMSLAEISAMFEKLQKQPIVAGAVLNLASTAKDAAQLDFSITILLQSAEEDGT